MPAAALFASHASKNGCTGSSPPNWKSSNHWNFVSFGERFETTDPSLHTWRQAPGDKFGPGSNTNNRSFPRYWVAGGQWFTRIPNRLDGTPPDPKFGNRMISLSDGWQWQLGTYDMHAETWSPTVVNGLANPPGVTNNGDGGDGDAVQWGVGQFAGDRMLNLFWARGMGWGGFGGGLSLLREVNFDPRLLGHSTGGLVANPISELAQLRNGTLANETSVRLRPGVPHVLGRTAAEDSAASADVVATFTLPTTSAAVSFGVCVLSDPSTANVGIGVVANISAADSSTGQRTANAWIGLCGPATGWGHGYGHRTTGRFPIFKGEREVDFRVLVDRSIVEAFLMGGRGVFSQGTNGAFPGSSNQTWDADLHHGYPTAVQIFASGAETMANVAVHSMGCGWVDEPWCARPPCPGITPRPSPPPPPPPPPAPSLYACVIDGHGNDVCMLAGPGTKGVPLPDCQKTCKARAQTILQHGQVEEVRILPSDKWLQFSGRVRPDGQAVSFDHPGVELRLRVAGASSVSVELLQQRAPPVKVGHNTYASFQPHYFVVVVNGSVVPGFANATFSTAECQNTTATTITAVAGLDASASHDVRIFHSSEAQWAASVPAPNWLTLTAVVLAGGRDASGSNGPGLLELPPWRPTRRLEFVGDSITAGYCNLLWVPDIDRHKTNRSNIESFWLSWPTRTCEALGAECHTAAWSGFALTHSHFCDKPVTMPEIWERTLASDDKADWAFDAWKPQAVVINLGTNDWHGVPDDWSTPLVSSFVANFTQTYHDFVDRIVSVYGPSTHVFVAVGPMTLGYLLPAQWVVGNATAKGQKAHLLNQSGFSHGDCGHPSFQSDEAMAEAAAAAIASELGWQTLT